jgi:CheY-like chemotaxis protein
LPPLILLAEDHEAFTQAIRDHLMHHGYRVSLASNGVETVERAREEVPDLILMDIQMPKMDGLEATRLIRSDDRLHAIPIVALTALVLAGDKARCLEAGADEYLRKPIRLQNLLATIESLLADRRAPANKARAG